VEEMNNFKKMFNTVKDTLKYLPLAATAFLAQELKGQDIWARPFPLPTEPVNLFLTDGSTPLEFSYDALTSKAARDAIMPGKVTSDISGKIVASDWNCNRGAPLFEYDAHNWGKDIYAFGRLLYNGYDGEDYALIRLNMGTTKFNATLGIPAGTVDIQAYAANIQHTQVYVLTGDHAKEGNNYNFMETMAPWLKTDVKPGQVYIPMNADTVIINYSYIYQTPAHEKNLAVIPVIWLKIVNGQYEFVASNPNVKIIFDRETTAPKINVRKSDPDSLIINTTAQYIKKLELIIDGGTPIPISQTEKRKALPGTHTYKINADNYNRLHSDTTFTWVITQPKPANTSITYPSNNQTEVAQPIHFTNTSSANSEKYQWRIFLDQNNTPALDTMVNINAFDYNKLKTNRKYTAMVRGVNSGGNGDWSLISQFVTFNNAPTISLINPKSTDIIDPKQSVQFEYNASDKDGDPLTAKIHLWSATKDTTIVGITASPYILPPSRLKPSSIYNYTVEVNDGSKSATSNQVTFATKAEPDPSTAIKSLILYPNPSKEGNINIRGTLSAPGITTSIYGMNGLKIREIKSGPISESIEETINLGDITPGNYIIRIQTDVIKGKQFSTTRKLIIK
jgi:hypothetical protein